MSDFITLRSFADDSMRSGDYGKANDHYNAAWGDYAAKRKRADTAGKVRQFDKRYTANDAFWLLLSGANAQFCLGDFEGCHDTLVTAFNLFKDLGYVAGNPFFHLRLGQASFELDPPGHRDAQGMTIEHLARALICGGIEVFRNEDVKYLNPVLEVLRPPKGYASWQDAKNEGCTLDKLNGATGFLAETFASKFGAPPPYPAPIRPHKNRFNRSRKPRRF